MEVVLIITRHYIIKSSTVNLKCHNNDFQYKIDNLKLVIYPTLLSINPHSMRIKTLAMLLPSLIIIITNL